MDAVVQRGPSLDLGLEYCRMRLPPGVVPGMVEQIELVQGGAVVSTTYLGTPMPGERGLSIDIPPWTRPVADITAVVSFRRPQPASRASAPLSRSAFHLHSSDIRDLTMSSPAPDDAPLAAQKYSYALLVADFGTSRSVTAIHDFARAEYSPLGPLSDAATTRAFDHIGLEPERQIFPILELDIETAGDPEWQDEVWSIVFSTPPLEELRLSASEPISSTLRVGAGGEVAFDERAVGSPAPGTTVHRGVKRWLKHPDDQLDGTKVKAGDVVAGAYQDLVHGQEEEMGDPFQWLHVTYPVTLPADLKDGLSHRLTGLAKFVELGVDEAAAAASFWIMTEFGADPVLGAEAFKAAARCPEGYFAWERPDLWREVQAWHQYYLVIDIGGGTTDCAVVKVVLRDDTPPEAAAGAGRFYVVAPQVMSSGGEFDIGGDMITLEIFKILKRLLGADSQTKFDGVTDSTSRRLVFDELWELAERVKIAGLAGDEPVDITVVVGGVPDQSDRGDPQVISARLTVDEWQKAGGAPVVPAHLVVTAAELGKITEAVAQRVAVIASGIANGGLPDPGGVDQGAIDRVIFSGGSAISASLRKGIESRLHARLTDSTFETKFDADHTKTGTALGVAWLKRWEAFKPQPRAVLDRLNAGRAYFDVDASRLHVNLAADFVYAEQGGREQIVLERGTPLQPGPGGRRSAISKRWPLVPQVVIRRGDDESRYIEWGQEAIGPEPFTAGLDRQGVGIRFEVDDEERVFMLLCSGEPEYDITQGTVLLGADADVPLVAGGVTAVDLVHDYSSMDLSRRQPLPCVNAGVTVGTGVIVPVEPGLLYRRVNVPRDDGLDNAAAEDQKDRYEVVATVPVGHRWLSLTSDGTLRTHAEYPDFRQVDSLGKVPANPGAVYRQRLDSSTQYDKQKDPFSGVH